MLRSQHHHNRPRLHSAVEIDHVFIRQPDAARRNCMSDPSRLIRSVDAVKRILAAGVKVQCARTHWIARTAFDIVRKRAKPPLLTLGRRPSRPFCLAANCGHAGPSLGILTHNRAVANRPTFGKHVVQVASVGIDQDRAWRFLPVVLNDLAPIGGWNPRLLVGWVCQLLSVACRELASGTVTGELLGPPKSASKMFWDR